MQVAQSCPTLCNPMGYTVRGILQTRILEWVAFPFSRGILSTQGSNPGFPHCRWILYQLSHKGNPVRPLATGNKGPSSLVIFLERFFPLCVPFPCPLTHNESLSDCSIHVSLGQSQLAPRGSCLSVFVPGAVDLERNGPSHSVH